MEDDARAAKAGAPTNPTERATECLSGAKANVLAANMVTDAMAMVVIFMFVCCGLVLFVLCSRPFIVTLSC